MLFYHQILAGDGGGTVCLGLMHISQIKVNFGALENEGFNKWRHYSIDTMFILIC